MHPAPRLAQTQHAVSSRVFGVDFLPPLPPPAPPPTHAAPSAVHPATRAGHDAPARQPSDPTTAAGPPGSIIEPAPGPADPARAEAHQRLGQILARYKADAPHRHFVTAFTNIVFGEGDPRARLMFVGEAPGADEDRTGRPFVGRAGQLLERMITAMGLSRQSVYIANVLKTRPPNNATPTLDECARCLPYLMMQIAAVRPEAIVTLGLTATRALLTTDLTMSRLRGQWQTLAVPDAQPALSVQVMPTFHPAFLLRQYTAENRAKVWSDLQAVMTRLGIKPTGVG
ncbi:MAG: hypothetical protein C0475_02310 [Planctomyces sp.]|nr:hypothetical protein [Planctomyces sp.]MBA4038904.1 hypothetical protein [Planctomyces sp.]MBA4120596.1 hypothetical protein [Isosphaera sp.]